MRIIDNENICPYLLSKFGHVVMVWLFIDVKYTWNKCLNPKNFSVNYNRWQWGSHVSNIYYRLLYECTLSLLFKLLDSSLGLYVYMNGISPNSFFFFHNIWPARYEWENPPPNKPFYYVHLFFFYRISPCLICYLTTTKWALYVALYLLYNEVPFFVIC